MLKIPWKHFYSVPVLLFILRFHITSPFSCWLWEFSLSEPTKAKRRIWISAPSLGSLPAAHIRTHSSLQIWLPQSSNLTLFTIPETPSCPKIQYISQETTSPWLPCSLISYNVCSVIELSSNKPWSPVLSSFGARGTRNSPLPASPPSPTALQPTIYHLSIPGTSLICSFTGANPGVKLLFLKVPFPRVDTISIYPRL